MLSFFPMADISASAVSVDDTAVASARLSFPLPHPASERMWARVPRVGKPAQIDTIGVDGSGPFHDTAGGQPLVELRRQQGGTVAVASLGEAV